MGRTRASFDVYLGTGLVHYFSPKHHPRALKLLEGVLQLDPNAITCLMGRGSIFQAQGEYAAARKDFQRVLNLETAGASEDQPFAGSDAALKAGEEIGWCLVKEDSLQDGKVVLEKVATALENLPGQEVAASRVEWRIGVVEWEMGGEFVLALRVSDTQQAYDVTFRYLSGISRRGPRPLRVIAQDQPFLPSGIHLAWYLVFGRSEPARRGPGIQVFPKSIRVGCHRS